MHTVVLTLLDGFQPLDVVGPHDVLSGANERLAARDRYRLVLAAPSAGPVAAESGLALVATHAFADVRSIGTLLVPGGAGVRRAATDPAVVAWLTRAAARATRVVSICTGAFALAATGVLDGLPVATHWAHAAALAERHPQLDVQVEPLYLRAGRVWTSAGVTSGMDLALALVEADHGTDLAQEVARDLVLYARRPGGQSQFAAPVWAPPAPRPSVRAAQDLIHADPSADHRNDVLAARVGMSTRHFCREFTRLLGRSPAAYVEEVRVDAARRLLESEPVLLSVAAGRCGFGSTETMRQAFHRRLGVAPDHYRRTHAAHT